MRINAEILSVQSQGDSLKVGVQGREQNAADWRPWLVFDLQLPNTAKISKALYVGRKIRVEVTTS